MATKEKKDLKALLQDPIYRDHYVRYLIWGKHAFNFPLKLIEKLKLPEPIVIDMMNCHNQELKRYKRKSKMWNKK